MQPGFSIITTCKGRLDHLKQSLPSFVAQPRAETIVVDYACPDGAADYVEQHFPEVRTVRIEDAPFFSNWKARNAGAEVARGKTLLFCDADIVLAKDATDTIARLLSGKMFGHFDLDSTQSLIKAESALSMNQLKGFHVVPAAIFRDMNGYDGLIEGYAGGADTELENRLSYDGFEPCELPLEIIDRVIEHDDADRLRFHQDSIRVSYATGLMYRSLKMAVARMKLTRDLTPEVEYALYNVSKEAAAGLDGGSKAARLSVTVSNEAIRMPRQLGMKQGCLRIKLVLEIVGQ